MSALAVAHAPRALEVAGSVIEQNVLGALLIDGSALDEIDGVISARDFEDGRHAAIFKIMESQRAAGKAFDVVTVFEALPAAERVADMLSYLNGIAQGVPGAGNVRHYAELMRERAVSRGRAAAAAELQTEVLKPAPNEERIAELTGRVAEAPTRVSASERLTAARRRLLRSASQRQAPEYPTAALGPLAEVCTTVAEQGQVQPAMVGQCLLGAASLLVQGLFDVQTLAGQRPLSLYLLTLGDSGDGKSAAQSVALGAIHEWQRQQARAHDAALQQWRSLRGEARGAPPVAPFRVTRDATVEGIRRDLDTGVFTQGVFNDEAAAILSGYGMSAEQRGKTAAVLSGLWDSGHLSVSRAGDGRVERYGRRVAMHWLLQPVAAAESTASGLLADIGFWPRFLLAWPEPLPPRAYRPFRAAEHRSVGAFWERCRELLVEPLGEDATSCPVLPLADAARDLLGRAMEQFERDGRRGALRPVKPFALRATEQACRVAGVLAAFAGRNEVSEVDAQNALALVAYSIESWRGLLEDGQGDPTSANALRLFEWLLDAKHCHDGSAKLSRIINAGPACVRTRAKRDDAIDALVHARLVWLSDDRSSVRVREGAP